MILFLSFFFFDPTLTTFSIFHFSFLPLSSTIRKRKTYLMESAPYGFQSSGIAGANPKYVRFQNKRSKEPRWYTITINFDTKEFLLESDEEKQLYKVDLIDLHKHWPLCVGICGHHNTTIEMVCFFIFFRNHLHKKNEEISFWFWFYWKNSFPESEPVLFSQTSEEGLMNWNN